MRLSALSFLLLTLSLPLLAHYDRDDRNDRGYRHPGRHYRMDSMDCGPRFVAERPLSPHWNRPFRVFRPAPRRWCEHEREVLYLPPPPPVIVGSPLRLWIGF